MKDNRYHLIYAFIFLFFSVTFLIQADSVDFTLFTISSRNTSSSVLKEKGRPDTFYGADKATDGNQKTSWCSGNKNPEGEWLSVQLREDKTVYSNRIHVFHGVGANRILYGQNNRIKDFELIVTQKNGKITRHKGKFNDTACGEPDPRYCDAEAYETGNNKNREVVYDNCIKESRKECFAWPETYGNFSGEEVVLHDPVCIKEIKIIIKSVYPGSKYRDTCITEISAQNSLYMSDEEKKQKKACEGE